MSEIRMTVEYDLKSLLGSLVTEQDDLNEIYLFGSRSYGTGSLRSDCDLLIRPTTGKNVKSSELRDFALTNCEALDLFLVEGGTARSCANDSYVYAATFDQLAERMDAALLWTRSAGFTDFTFRDCGSWAFKTAKNVNFIPTTLPDEYLGEQAWLGKITTVEQSGLPIRPYIGDDLAKAVTFIQEVARRMIIRPDQLGQRGHARGGWTVNLRNEYDCQNLFYTVVKPWLPGLGREEIAIQFDDQKKFSDFSLFEGKLIIEMKFIDSGVTKAAVAKTLQGLSRFDSRNANVRCLLMIVYVKADAIDVDPTRWETEFTHIHNAPSVITMVIKLP